MHLPSYPESAFAHLDSIMQLSVMEFIPKSQIEELEEGWYLIGWDSLPGKEATMPDFSKGQAISLPYRIPNANTNIWFSNELDLEQGYLRVIADDGAQIWINGKQIPQNEELFYPIQKSTGESYKIQIRVINNAASGGLKKVYWVKKEGFENGKAKKLKSLEMVLQKAKEELWTGNNTPDSWEDYPIWFSNPILIPTENDSIMVRWNGEENTKAKLHFGTDPKLILNTLEVLEEDGVYTAYIPKDKNCYYFFEMNKTISPIFKAKIRNSSKPIVFSVWADSQGGWSVFRKILAEMKKHQPKFTLGLGDLVGNGGNPWQYIRLQNELHQVTVPHYLFAGNHDYDASYDYWIPENFNRFLKDETMKTYQFWTNEYCAFIALDPNENFPVGVNENSEQYQWFQNKINSESWKKSPWKIILVHQPPFSQGWKGYQGEQSIRNLLLPFWEAGLIDLVISGHTHDYERLILEHQNGKTGFLIVGGAGGNLEPDDQLDKSPKMDKVIRTHHFGLIKASSTDLEFTAIDSNGNEIDSFNFRK